MSLHQVEIGRCGQIRRASITLICEYLYERALRVAIYDEVDPGRSRNVKEQGSSF